MDAIICFATVCQREEGNKINCNALLILFGNIQHNKVRNLL